MNESENNLEQRDNKLNREMKNHPAEQSIEVLVRDAKSRSRQLHILTGTVILMLFMLIGLGVVSYKLYQITKLAQSNKTAVIQNCETANDSRRNQIKLWDYVFSIAPDKPATDAEAKQTEEFRTFVATTFAPRDCQAESNK